MKIILTDRKGICWKVYLNNNMKLIEILECIEKQFYPKECNK